MKALVPRIDSVRWFVWNQQLTTANVYHDSEKLKFQISHLVLFYFLNPFRLVSMIRSLFEQL
jgi:hypothetical protein